MPRTTLNRYLELLTAVFLIKQIPAWSASQTPDGHVVAIEVKAGATIGAEDLAGLRHLAQRLGPRLVAGYVLWEAAPL